MMTADTTSPKYRRRFKWLAMAIVLAVALYSGGWYYVAGLVGGETERMLADANRNGRRVNCENKSVNGYPFRLGVNCDSVLVESAIDGVSFSAGAFRTAAQVYDPVFLLWELDAPARLEAPGLIPLALNWEQLRSSVRLARPLPSRVSVEFRKLAAASEEGGRSPSLFVADSGEAHFRPNEASLVLAASFAGLRLGAGLAGNRSIPALDGGVDVQIENGVRWLSTGGESLRGQSGSLREAYLSPAAGSVIRAAGPFSVAEDGLIDAQLTITVQGIENIANAATGAFPESSGQIASFAASLKALGEGAELPLRVVRGKVSYGFMELGDIPSLP